MNEYLITDLDGLDELKANNAIDFFANSSYENRFFLKHFLEPSADSIHSKKKYWESFARILVRRGLPKINDVKNELLIWWQDENWPGFNVIEKFVIENKDDFLPNIVDAIKQGIETKDPIWFKNLVSIYTQINSSILFDRNLTILNDACDYLEDDSWKEFDDIFLSKIKEIIEY